MGLLVYREDLPTGHKIRSEGVLLCYLWQQLNIKSSTYRQWFADNLVMVWLMLVINLIYSVVSRSAGVVMSWSYRGGIFSSFPVMALLLSVLIISFAYIIKVYQGWRSGHSFKKICIEVPDEIVAFLTYRRLWNWLMGLLPVMLLASRFLVMKSLIPHVHPYSWDLTWMEWDRWLFGGYDPYAWLMPYLSADVMWVFDRLYMQWFTVMAVMHQWMALQLDPMRRQTYFLAYLGSWLLVGLVAALIFSSCGPAFYNKLTAYHHEMYATLNAMNAKFNSMISLGSFSTQALLLVNVQQGSLNIMSGISAMPSMHIGIITVWLCALWPGHKGVWWTVFIYGLLMMVAVVALGWHYFVDGLVASVLVGVWYACSYQLIKRLSWMHCND